MAGAYTDSQGRRYACKCLNIRIRQASCPSTQPEFGGDPDFIPVYAGEEGILVEHTQLTVRTRTPGTPIAETSRFYRYTTITCLLCDTLVYRVYHTYATDVEGKEGPLLPTEDWAERDIMKSLSGWIQVHNNCLAGNDAEKATSSEDYSPLFSVILPPTPAQSSPTLTEPIFERPSSRSSVSPPPPPPQFFSNLRPVYLPPPFTPSHPVFMYLSSLATKQSEEMREAAEREMVEKLKAKTSEIEQADVELRKNVESLWKKFREGVARIKLEHPQPAGTAGSKERRMTQGVASVAPPTLQPIRDFSPSKEPVVFSPSSVPRLSALSASLKTSSFHHPRAKDDRSTSPATNSSSSDATASSNVSKSVPPGQHDTGNILKYRRNFEDNTDYATSYRYFVIHDEDMRRARQQRSESARAEQAQNGEDNQPNGASDGPKADESTKRAKAKPAADKSDRNQDSIRSEGSPSGSREKGKGKRKVTFDIQPAVVTIKREVNAEKNQEQKPDDAAAREMIFDFEDTDEEGTDQSLSFKRQPQIEQPPVVARPRKPRQRDHSNLSTSFSGLRPASLPAPSNIRPPRSQHGSDASTSFALSIPNPHATRKDKGKAPEAPMATLTEEPSSEMANADDAEASGGEPIGRRLAYSEEDDTYREENDDEEDPRMYIGSMPVNIKKYRPPPPLTLASYQPKSTLAEKVVEEEEEEEEEEGLITPKRAPTSEAIRKAEYAERDRSRSVDPGFSDFQGSDAGDAVELEDDEAENSEQVGELGEGGRGRRRALKILQARSEVPEEGMWRSLAS